MQQNVDNLKYVFEIWKMLIHVWNTRAFFFYQKKSKKSQNENKQNSNNKTGLLTQIFLYTVITGGENATELMKRIHSNVILTIFTFELIWTYFIVYDIYKRIVQLTSSSLYVCSKLHIYTTSPVCNQIIALYYKYQSRYTHTQQLQFMHKNTPTNGCLSSYKCNFNW